MPCFQIYGLFLLKLAVGVVVAGGVQRIDQSGTRVRGEPHLLLVGDPGKTIYYLQKALSFQAFYSIPVLAACFLTTVDYLFLRIISQRIVDIC